MNTKNQNLEITLSKADQTAKETILEIRERDFTARLFYSLPALGKCLFHSHLPAELTGFSPMPTSSNKKTTSGGFLFGGESGI